MTAYDGIAVGGRLLEATARTLAYLRMIFKDMRHLQKTAR
jgi:hypothetical protein